jgi:HK97 family phage prohead protease
MSEHDTSRDGAPAAAGDRETRHADAIELRAAGEGMHGPGTLVGYAARFNRPSEPLVDKSTGSKRRFREIVKPGAFTRTLRSADVRALFGHDENMVLGRSRAQTLRMAEDEQGLRVEIDLPDTTAGRDAAVSVARGDITGMSFGFYVPKGGDSWDRSGDMPIRSLHDVDIDDVSLVAYPAYPDTSVALRSLERAEKEDEAAAEEVAEPEAEEAAESAAPLVPPLKTLLDRLRTYE